VGEAKTRRIVTDLREGNEARKRELFLFLKGFHRTSGGKTSFPLSSGSNVRKALMIGVVLGGLGEETFAWDSSRGKRVKGIALECGQNDEKKT